MERNIEIAKNYYQPSSSNPENIEGGLNLAEIKDIIVRKLPLIAGCTISLTSLAFLKVVITPPEYVAGFELLSEPVNIETKVTSTNDDSRETREEITSVELDEVQLKILKSPRLISRVIESLEDKYPELTYPELASGLTIEIISGSKKSQNILQVIYSDPDKQKVADVVEALNQTYQAYSVEKRQSGVNRGIDFLDRQIPQVSERTEQIEAEISELRTQYNFNDPDTSIDKITSRIAQLSQRREDNAIELEELNLTLSNLEQELAVEPEKSTTAIELATPRYMELLSRLRELDLEINQKSTIYADRSETMQVLQEEKQQLKDLIIEAGANIRQKLANKITVLENRQRVLNAQMEDFETQLEKWSAISVEYQGLRNKLDRANNKLNGFTSQKDALQIDAVQQDAPWQLLTPATEPRINNISTVNYLLLGSTLGLILGVGIAFILDKQQKIVYSASKVEEITNLPILGNIPYISKGKEASLLKQLTPNRSSLSSSQMQLERLNQSSSNFFIPSSIEAFRSFAANLDFFNFSNDIEDFDLDTKLKSIVVTSATAGEGKSTVALNLARASASMGKKVLLVDTDLRSTNCLTKNLGLESTLGLMNILNDEDSTATLGCIQQIPLEENLFILTSGFEDPASNPIQRDPSRLLASNKMHSVMNKLRKHFDLIIYDLCAIIGFADVNLLANKTDGIIMVAGLGKIQTTVLNEALSQLRLCQAPILGVAVNKTVNQT